MPYISSWHSAVTAGRDEQHGRRLLPRLGGGDACICVQIRACVKQVALKCSICLVLAVK